MNWIVAHMKGILIISGLMTFSMIQAAIAPEAALAATFGSSLQGPVATLIVRNWGVLIALIGLMLVVAAFRVQHRVLVLTVASISKFAFITLVLAHGSEYLAYQAGLAVAVDTVMVTLFTAYLLSTGLNGSALSASSLPRIPSSA